MRNPRFQWNGWGVSKVPDHTPWLGKGRVCRGTFREGDFTAVGKVTLHTPETAPAFYTVEVRSEKATRGFPERGYIGVRGDFEGSFLLARGLLHMLYRAYMEHCAKQRRDHADRVFHAKARAKWESIWPAIREFRKDFYK